jgi:hypothetical protein
VIRHQIARILSAIADRIEPNPPEPDVVHCAATDALAALIGGPIEPRGFSPGRGANHSY